MWTVVYMTQNEENATKVIKVLNENNLIYKLRPVGDNNNENECFEVLVPETEVNEAHSIIIENNLM